MKINLYPNFDEVFTDETLKGIFYPLCSLTLEKYPNKVFHFISSNGLWMDEDFEIKNNTVNYTLFDIVDNKYKFNGNIQLYKGYRYAKDVVDKLQNDFDLNGKYYIETRTQTEDYIEKQKRNLALETDDDFDVDYYIQTFYEFSINKLNFELTNEFGAFREIIDDWPGRDQISPVVYDETTDELKGALNDYDKPDIDNIDTFEVIGKIVGFEFFTDGNDILLFYSRSCKILCINSYS
ncbi:hypothetical protein PBAL39_00877 [Pedobacter sp. BAL39]|uniref:hypothetical protein n=1 Tax=Pedobacter sp. BAL39 TaxID=391596 RepID=UPI0001559EB0|nr:hypothetical protein [Pedobacter sp. BAL39]EDM38124.1 hypothetical protein PBAL39_00877 [Pedobacter sp. BAL39]